MIHIEPLQPSAEAYKLNHGGQQSFVRAVKGKKKLKILPKTKPKALIKKKQAEAEALV